MLTFLGLGTRVARRRPLLGQARKKWSIGACVLAGVFGHALLQRADGVIHAAIALPPSRLLLLLLRLRRFVNKST